MAKRNQLTVISIAICAAVAADVVHEAVGHGIASRLVGDPILSISTVALQNAWNSRLVSAAGTSANCLVGAAVLLTVRWVGFGSALTCLFWLFGAFNVLNSGYLLSSGLFGGGDWGNVVSGCEPAVLWRMLLVVAGAVLYWLSIRFIAWSMGAALELAQVVLPAYFAAGAVMTIASLFNPISPTLIVVSGVAASFGLNAGLLLIPGLVRNSPGRSVPCSAVWVMLAMVVAAWFIGVLAPGIDFNSATAGLYPQGQ